MDLKRRALLLGGSLAALAAAIPRAMAAALGYPRALQGPMVGAPGPHHFTVWVRATPDEHMTRVMEQGDMRPMARSGRAMEDLMAILKSREPLYAKAACELVTTGKSPEQNMAELLRLLPVSGNRFDRKSA